VEYLRVGGIFRGNIPPTNSSEAKNAGGEYPALWRILEEFFSLIKILYHLFLIGFDIVAEEKKEIDERILLVLLQIMLLQKTFKILSHWDL
jgi:hypothetical protein